MCRDSWLGRPRVDDLKADLHPSKNVKFGIRRTLQFPVTASIDRNDYLATEVSKKLVVSMPLGRIRMTTNLDPLDPTAIRAFAVPNH